MKEGKLSSELLRELVFDNIKVRRKEVILRPEIGEDCAAIEFGDYACVLSTDPITGAEKGIGALAVHISCNDVASSGVKPLALLMTIMAPTYCVEEDIRRIMQEAGDAAKELDVEIVGGHTEVTSAVNRVVISTTAIGKIIKNKLVKSSGAKLNDDVVMTKWAGLEGTAIIAADKEAQLKEILSSEELKTAQGFIRNISVVKEGVLSGEAGANCMHDVTEGGILGAAWEIAESAGLGIEVNLDDIPVHAVTHKICKIFGIDPYRLISSGSMLITAPNGNELLQLLKSNGIEAAIIGRMTVKDRLLIKAGSKNPMEPPREDELFKVKNL